MLLGWLASIAWFLTDDAFISFRYVRNLLEGHGLVFNPGEYVEGYTNFLWVLELAALWGVFGLRPEQAAPWLSVAYTAGTLAAMLWWAARTPRLRHRKLVAWMALGLVCSSATFAVWTSGGGLETRQFTFFIVLAVVCLGLYRHRRGGLLAASLSLAAAAGTRPEGLLIAVCCFGWSAASHIAVAQRLRPTQQELRGFAYLVTPFVVLVAAHFLFRYAYYGEWLPNTYYAKHIGHWYEAGFRYLSAAALETGLYLLAPLAFAGLCVRWKSERDAIHALPLVCIAAHLAYIMRIGGDHFEYRPLDFYWPLLALPAAVGIVSIGERARDWLRSLRARPSGERGAPAAAIALFFTVLFFANVVQNTWLYLEGGAATRRPVLDIVVGLGLLVPGVQPLLAIVNDLNQGLYRQFVGLKAGSHGRFAERRIRDWSPYEGMDREVVPDDAVMAMGAIGIPAYYVPALTVVDIYGLTDARVARHPVATDNEDRIMAHDRRPPLGYFDERGVNFKIHAPAEDALEALARASHAARIGPNLWMPFDAYDPGWAEDRFSGRDLRAANDSPGIRVLSSFEEGWGGWQSSGDGIKVHTTSERYPRALPVTGYAGRRYLTSSHPRKKHAATGAARSPVFLSLIHI